MAKRATKTPLASKTEKINPISLYVSNYGDTEAINDVYKLIDHFIRFHEVAYANTVQESKEHAWQHLYKKDTFARARDVLIREFGPPPEKEAPAPAKAEDAEVVPFDPGVSQF